MNKSTTFIVALIGCLFAQHSLALPRDKTERSHFVKENPCPSTGSSKGSCPGYQVDHKVALRNGGKDKPSNMQWLSKEEHKKKSSAEAKEAAKERRESKATHRSKR